MVKERAISTDRDERKSKVCIYVCDWRDSTTERKRPIYAKGITRYITLLRSTFVRSIVELVSLTLENDEAFRIRHQLVD